MESYPGKKLFTVGAVLIGPHVFFGLGMVGFGEDYLTKFTGDFVVSKAIVGVATVACVLSMVRGYITMRDGITVVLNTR